MHSLAKLTAKVDKPFLLTIIALTVLGFFIFSSASLGVLTRSEDQFKAIALNQFLFGLCAGAVAMFVTAITPYKFWKKISLGAFIFSVILAILVFVPGIGWRHGGATRWIAIGSFNFQPAEILKMGYIIYLAALLSKYKDKIHTFKYGIVPFCILTGIVGVLLVLQPDNDTFFMTAMAGLAMLFVSGARLRHIAILFLIGLLSAGLIFATRPYVRERVMTFLHPDKNALTSGYQIQQSLIAIGSGGILGKGFGQSTQKFGFLPEPIGDSIYAVASEEFGFLGSVIIIVLFLYFTVRGLKIAATAQDEFGRLLVIGIIILIIAGSFFNIAAMLAIMPLSGTPLLFISHGGTALFLTLAEVGIILNISKRKNSRTSKAE